MLHSAIFRFPRTQRRRRHRFPTWKHSLLLLFMGSYLSPPSSCRRDSFITHRAFCDALAQESARLPPGLNSAIINHSFASNAANSNISQLNPLQDQTHNSADLFIPHRNPNSSLFHQPQGEASSSFFLGQELQDPQTHPSFLQSKPFNGLLQLPELHGGGAASSSSSAPPSTTSGLFNLGAFSNNRTTSNLSSINSHLLMQDQLGSGGGISSLYDSPVHKEQALPQMSATALLQKAAQMGATTSSSGSTMLRAYGNPKTGNFRFNGTGDQSMRIQMENETHLQDLMNSLAHGGVGVFGGGGNEQQSVFGGFYQNLCNMDAAAKLRNSMSMGGSIGGSDRFTRDFLGVGSMVRNMGSEVSQRETHLPVDMSSEMKSPPARSPFPGGNLQ